MNCRKQRAVKQGLDIRNKTSLLQLSYVDGTVNCEDSYLLALISSPCGGRLIPSRVRDLRLPPIFTSNNKGVIRSR